MAEDNHDKAKCETAEAPDKAEKAWHDKAQSCKLCKDAKQLSAQMQHEKEEHEAGTKWFMSSVNRWKLIILHKRCLWVT